MTAREILAHFHSLAGTVEPPIDLRVTADRVVLGDPDRPVKRVLVTWMSSTEAVRAAVDGSFDMLVTHEATLWGPEPDILDRREPDVSEVRRPGETKVDTIITWAPGTLRWEKALEKRRYIEGTGVVVMRMHDLWDRLPGVGIPWSWARFLGLGETPVRVSGGDRAEHRYDIAPLALDELARRVAARTATLGEPVVSVVGDGKRTVSRVGVGTGCGTNIYKYLDIGCDVGIVCDDMWEVRCFLDVAFARDAGFPIIKVNHGTAEDPGMVSLTAYMRRTFPGLAAVEYLRHGNFYRMVGQP
jgi:putative NIF3 family GTP cyclohydrolase 1 type 2